MLIWNHRKLIREKYFIYCKHLNALSMTQRRHDPLRMPNWNMSAPALFY